MNKTMDEREFKVYVLKKNKWIPLDDKDWELLNDNSVFIKIVDAGSYQFKFQPGKFTQNPTTPRTPDRKPCQPPGRSRPSPR